MTLTNFPYDPVLDLAPWVGQRQATFRFQLINGVSDQHLGDITPIRGASLTHDTRRTIKRQLSLNLGVADTAAINPLTDRVLPYMKFPNGTEYPLGRYMFTDASRQKFTSGRLGDMVLNDEMFLVDQQITAGISGVGRANSTVIQDVLEGLPITYALEPSPYISVEAWGFGAYRGQILNSLAITGDYFSGWFDNHGVLRFIRAFNAANEIPDFDFDVGNKVVRANILETDNLLTAPNVFIVVSNVPGENGSQIVGIAMVPPTAPNSVASRGFTIAEVQNIQLNDPTQAQAVANNLSLQNGLYEQVSLITAPDPRHDSYNIIHWQGENWLEIGWTMSLIEGGAMRHELKRAYA